MLDDYWNRMYGSLGDQLSPPTIPLPTMGAWKLIEDPKEFSYKDMSFFIVTDAGIVWYYHQQPSLVTWTLLGIHLGGNLLSM